MKTLEEIKEELKEEIPVHYHLPNPEARLRHTDLMKLQNLHACTLTYIQQLESRLAQVERERDALMRDLRDVGACDGCIHDRDPMIHDSCIACRRCHPNDSDGMFDHWQWRGVCPENTKEV